eukprot:UC1_evm1s944
MVHVDGETGEAEFQLEAPAGLIGIRAQTHAGDTTTSGQGGVSVTLDNVPAFHARAGLPVHVPELGIVNVDIAFGGMWYVVVEAASVGLEILPQNGKQLARLGEMIKTAAREQYPIQHPTMDYEGPDILVFTGPATQREGGETQTEEEGKMKTAKAHARNTVVMTNGTLDWKRKETWTGMLDRSPCGTGTCAVMATRHARGELALGEDFVHEGI